MLSLEAKDQKLKKIEFSTPTDTLSYAFGAQLASQGLKNYLVQLEVISDTTTVGSALRKQIEEASTDKEKKELQKKLQFKLDSIDNSNKKNLTTFFSGVYERINNTQDKNFNRGVDLGSQVQEVSRKFSEETLGEGKDPIDLNLVVAAITDVITDKPLKVSNFEEVVQQESQNAQERKAEESKKISEQKIADNEKFMAENAQKEGVVTLPSGIQYQIEKAGTGAKPKATDMVKVHYAGTLLDGTEFDSSIKRGEPITFGVQQVIPGWTEVLQLMPVGSKWKVVIPYSLAYGEKATGPIPAYSNLIFDIELLDIVDNE